MMCAAHLHHNSCSSNFDEDWAWADGIALPEKRPKYDYKDTKEYARLLKVSLYERKMFAHRDNLLQRILASPATDAFNAETNDVFPKTIPADLIPAVELLMRVRH